MGDGISMQPAAMDGQVAAAFTARHGWIVSFIIHREMCLDRITILYQQPLLRLHTS